MAVLWLCLGRSHNRAAIEVHEPPIAPPYVSHLKSKHVFFSDALLPGENISVVMEFD